MSSHMRLVGDAGSSFFDRFFSLEKNDAVIDLVEDSLLDPTNRAINRAIKNHLYAIRLGAPLVGCAYGMLQVARAVAFLAESAFKGFANLLLGVCSLSMKRISNGLSQIGYGSYGGAFLTLKAIVVASLGTVGLIVAPRWTFKNLFLFED